MLPPAHTPFLRDFIPSLTKTARFSTIKERIMRKREGMPSLLDNLRYLEAAQGYADLGLYMQSNLELEQMSPDTRHWPEVLAVKLIIFNCLNLWEMVEIIATQLTDSAQGNPRWTSIAENARLETRAALAREHAEFAKSVSRKPTRKEVYPS